MSQCKTFSLANSRELSTHFLLFVGLLKLCTFCSPKLQLMIASKKFLFHWRACIQNISGLSRNSTSPLMVKQMVRQRKGFALVILPISSFLCRYICTEETCTANPQNVFRSLLNFPEFFDLWVSLISIFRLIHLVFRRANNCRVLHSLCCWMNVNKPHP